MDDKLSVVFQYLSTRKLPQHRLFYDFLRAQKRVVSNASLLKPNTLMGVIVVVYSPSERVISF